ncbi:hypothetical protein ACFQ6U_14130 [Streptomyces sp. NPDC056465]|uniref:hypothetical protein n=1 Tax=unclassified Streptomyces TaxID=2593676 RepID=UPI0035DC4614
MSAALVVKSLAELGESFGPMRVVLSSETGTDVVPEQAEAYALNVLGGKGLGESVINGSDGNADLIIRFVEFIDPVTQKRRFGVDYWSIDRYYTLDHAYLCMAEAAYQAVVRGEFAAPSLTSDRDRFGRGLASFYDVTDVV